MKNPNSRREKIHLLKDLESGRRSIDELNAEAFAIWIVDRKGMYSRGLGLKITEAEFETYQSKHPALRTVIVLPQKGNDPLEEKDE